MGKLNKLREFFQVKEKAGFSEKISSTDSMLGEQPEVEFSKLIEYYERTPQIQLSVDSFLELVVGTNINISAGDEEVKSVLEDYINNINLYDKIRASVHVELITGNQLLEKVDDDLIIVDMEKITGLNRDETGKIKSYKLQVDNEDLELPADKVIHLRFNQVGVKPWARSMFYSLAVTRSVNRGSDIIHTRPLVEQKWLIDDAMGSIFVNHANPMKFITFGDAPRQFIEDMLIKFKTMQPGDSIVADRKPEVDIIESDSNGKYDSYVKQLEQTFMVGTQFSYEIFLGNFTSRASSETTEDLIAKKVRAHQKDICNVIKRQILIPFLLKHPSKKWASIDLINRLNIQASFESQNVIAYTPETVGNRVIQGIWDKKEARNWDRANGANLESDE